MGPNNPNDNTGNLISPLLNGQIRDRLIINFEDPDVLQRFITGIGSDATYDGIQGVSSEVTIGTVISVSTPSGDTSIDYTISPSSPFQTQSFISVSPANGVRGHQVLVFVEEQQSTILDNRSEVTLSINGDLFTEDFNPVSVEITDVDAGLDETFILSDSLSSSLTLRDDLLSMLLGNTEDNR